MTRQNLYTSGGGRRKNNPRGICKLRLVGTQPLIVKSKARIVFKVDFRPHLGIVE